ncbi:hypothetical protein LCGC14_2096420 [marine sediment metagenome]|uniref:Uncharacterized protein n=1 Tax=marine sediment metagenome TaxID=412755 RepID=A0A0F9H7X1_9ZZZZ
MTATKTVRGDKKKLTTEQIKKSSEIAVRGFRIPKGWSEEAWLAATRACISAKEEYVLNSVRNKVSIHEALKIAEKAAKRK